MTPLSKEQALAELTAKIEDLAPNIGFYEKGKPLDFTLEDVLIAWKAHWPTFSKRKNKMKRAHWSIWTDGGVAILYTWPHLLLTAPRDHRLPAFPFVRMTQNRTSQAIYEAIAHPLTL